MPCLRASLAWSALLAFALLFFARSGLAAEACEGPADCCITKAEEAKAPLPTHVRLGLRIMRIEKMVEQDGNYSGELTLTSKWASGGLRPTPNPRNAVDITTSLDVTALRDGFCYRERRIVAKFQTWFRLRRFPFDA